MSNRPTISACIPVYNGAAYIARAIESVLGGTIPADEIIVIDDGSTDESADLAAAYKEVRVVRQANGGIGAARRRAVEEARHEWIAFCDHDDWWTPQRLERQVGYTSDPAVTLIYAGVWHVDENGVESEWPLHASPSDASIRHLVPHPEDIWTSSTLLRRSSILGVGNFLPEFRSGEDMIMWFRLGALGKILQVPERLVHMTRRSASTSAGNRKTHEYGVRIYEEQILPNFDLWFADIPEGERAEYKALLRRKLGYACSILANYYDVEGSREKAREYRRKAVTWNPRSKGVWYRYVRSRLGRAGTPPI